MSHNSHQHKENSKRPTREGANQRAGKPKERERERAWQCLPAPFVATLDPGFKFFRLSLFGFRPHT